jgi:transcriptional regulator with XRE-family HTH domain
VVKRQITTHKLPKGVSAQFAENLRFLLWQKGLPSVSWADEIRSTLGPDFEDARALLLGSKPADEPRLQKIARRFGVDLEELVFGDLLAAAKVNVVQANLSMLMKALGSGQKKLVAEYLGVNPSTVSRWLSGTQAPDRKTLHQLASYFHLKAGTDLATEPLFLSPHPISDSERRQWLLRRIKEIDAASLSELFPALARMLGGASK